MADIKKFEASEFKGKIKGLAMTANSLRTDKETPTDVTLAEVVQEQFDCTLSDLYESLGIDPTVDTIQNIFTMPDEDVRWLIPEIIRDSIRMGLREAPIWPNITATEQDINQMSVTMPYINMSEAVPHKVGEAETIPLGSISYGQKSVKTFKIGRGIKITYEIKQFVSLDVISIFFQDFGIRLGQALDTLAIDVLLNGDQANGSEAAPVIGIATPNDKVYKDFLRIWLRAARMGRKFTTIIGGEDSALDTLDLKEFKDRKSGTTDAKLNLKTPVPTDASYFIHGNVPADQEILLDPRFGLIKFNVIPLLIESDKIVSNQTEEFYASMTTGFGKIFKDSAVIMDSSLDFAANGFPTYMDVDAFQNVVLGN
jgi:hypothetical protein